MRRNSSALATAITLTVFFTPGCGSEDANNPGTSSGSGGGGTGVSGGSTSASGGSRSSGGFGGSTGTAGHGTSAASGGTTDSKSTTGGAPSSGGPSSSGGAANASGQGGVSAGQAGVPSGGTTGKASGGRDGTSSAGRTGASGGQASGGVAGGLNGGASAKGGSSASSGGGQGGSAGKSQGGSAGAASSNITIWIAGDSTVANGSTPCPAGWGGQFKPLFNDRVTVKNNAVGGRSVRNWLYSVSTTMDSNGNECLLNTDGSGAPIVNAGWQAMLDGMKPGDYLFIQFGINDGSKTCDRHVGLALFKNSYAMMAKAAKDRGAQPIFLTPVSAIACTGSTASGTRGDYVTATLDAGKENDVPVIELHALSVSLYNSLAFCPIPGGGDVSASTGGAVGDFFCEDHTHFEKAGATQIAAVVAKALRDQGISLAQYLK